MTLKIQQIKDSLKQLDTLMYLDFSGASEGVRSLSESISSLCDVVEALQKTVAEQEAKIEQLQRKGPWKF